MRQCRRHEETALNAFLETRRYEDGFPIDVFRVVNDRFLAHWHLDAEITFVVRGGIRIGANRVSRLMRAGEIAVLGSSDIHWYESEDPSSLVIVVIFRPEMAGAPEGWPQEGAFQNPFLTTRAMAGIPPSDRARIRALFPELERELGSRPAHYRLRVEGMVKELCALLLRHLALSPLPAPRKGVRLPDIERIQQAIRFLQGNSAQPLTLSGIARRCGLSDAYCSRLFKAFAGMTFHEYLARVRVDSAETLLHTTTRTVLDVALESGFRSVRTFNRVYRAYTGRAPRRPRTTPGAERLSAPEEPAPVISPSARPSRRSR